MKTNTEKKYYVTTESGTWHRVNVEEKKNRIYFEITKPFETIYDLCNLGDFGHDKYSGTAAWVQTWGEIPTYAGKDNWYNESDLRYSDTFLLSRIRLTNGLFDIKGEELPRRQFNEVVEFIKENNHLLSIQKSGETFYIRVHCEYPWDTFRVESIFMRIFKTEEWYWHWYGKPIAYHLTGYFKKGQEKEGYFIEKVSPLVEGGENLHLYDYLHLNGKKGNIPLRGELIIHDC